MIEVSFKLNGLETEFKVQCEEIREADALRHYFGGSIENGTFTVFGGNWLYRYETIKMIS